MTTDKARRAILDEIRYKTTHDKGTDQGRRDAVAQWLKTRKPGPLPTIGRHDDHLLERFTTVAEKESCTLTSVSNWDEVPHALSTYLKNTNLPAKVRLAPDERLLKANWLQNAPTLEITSGTAEKSDTASVTLAYAAIAETGTLVSRSAADSPTGLAFLPPTHIVVLEEKDLVGSMEEVWEKLRKESQGKSLPRSVNFITGPSRTGDIEQSIQFGAHGPERLHIILVISKEKA